jgi:hypothetical protein
LSGDLVQACTDGQQDGQQTASTHAEHVEALSAGLEHRRASLLVQLDTSQIDDTSDDQKLEWIRDASEQLNTLQTIVIAEKDRARQSSTQKRGPGDDEHWAKRPRN